MRKITLLILLSSISLFFISCGSAGNADPLSQPAVWQTDRAEEFSEIGIVEQVFPPNGYLKAAGIEAVRINLPEPKRTQIRHWTCIVPISLNLKVGDRVLVLSWAAYESEATPKKILLTVVPHPEP